MGVGSFIEMIYHPFSEFPLVARPDDPNWQDVTINFLIALGAYSIGDCETAQIYWDHVQTGMEAILVSSADVTYSGQLEQTIAYLHFYRGNCALINEDYPLAVDYFEESLQIYEQNGFDYRYGMDATINLAWALSQLDQTDQALAYLDQAIGSQFEWVQAHALMIRALVYAEESNFEAAYRDLNESERISGDELLTNIERIQFLILEGDYIDALAEIDRLEKNVAAPQALFFRALIAYQQEDINLAREYFEEYIESTPYGYMTNLALEYMEVMETEN
ncbi:MAG: hypothetical protein D6711_09080 [Chloroflexi bacterium]|nr:MAG: hypothetical protein D6711_09080 [Chloroflexota bacterium]